MYIYVYTHIHTYITAGGGIRLAWPLEVFEPMSDYAHGRNYYRYHYDCVHYRLYHCYCYHRNCYHYNNYHYRCRLSSLSLCTGQECLRPTSVLRILDIRGFGSSRILIMRGGILSTREPCTHRS